MSEDKTRQAIRHGDEASALVQNERLKDSFAYLRKLYTDELLNSKPDDEFKREKLYLAFNVLGKVEQHLHATISNGTVAKAELAEMIKKEKRKTSA